MSVNPVSKNPTPEIPGGENPVQQATEALKPFFVSLIDPENNFKAIYSNAAGNIGNHYGTTETSRIQFMMGLIKNIEGTMMNQLTNGDSTGHPNLADCQMALKFLLQPQTGGQISLLLVMGVSENLSGKELDNFKQVVAEMETINGVTANISYGSEGTVTNDSGVDPNQHLGLANFSSLTTEEKQELEGQAQALHNAAQNMLNSL